MGFNPDGSPDDGTNFTAPPAPTMGAGPNGYAGGTQYNERTGIADFAPGATTGQIADPNAYGGTSGAVVMGPDGKPMVDPSKSGRGMDVARDRGIADAASGRTAPTMDYYRGNVDRDNAQVTRGQQGVANSLLAGAAHGGMPSGAVIRGQGMTDNSFASQLGAQAGARGGATNQAAAGQAGANTAAAQQQGVAAQMGAARSNELTSARTAYSAGTNTTRRGDLQQQHTDQQRQRAQMENEMRQRELNQKRQLAYENLANQTNDAAMKVGIGNANNHSGSVLGDMRFDTGNERKIADFYASSGASLNASGGPSGGGGGGGQPQQQQQGGDSGGGGD